MSSLLAAKMLPQGLYTVQLGDYTVNEDKNGKAWYAIKLPVVEPEKYADMERIIDFNVFTASAAWVITGFMDALCPDDKFEDWDEERADSFSTDGKDSAGNDVNNDFIDFLKDHGGETFKVSLVHQTDKEGTVRPNVYRCHAASYSGQAAVQKGTNKPRGAAAGARNDD